MAEPYSDAHAEIAIKILSRAHDELVAAGLGQVEACAAMAHAAMDWLADYCCHEHLFEELDAVIGGAEMRQEWLREAVH